MKTISLLIALLVTLNPFACTRIVKHYHYHLGETSFPVSQSADTFATLNEFIYKNKSSLSRSEYDMLKKTRSDALVGNKSWAFLDFYLAAAQYVRENESTCQKVYDLFGKIIVIDDVSNKVKSCEQAIEYGIGYNRRRLETNVEMESRA